MDGGDLSLGMYIDAIWCEAVMSLNGCDEDETICILAGRPTMVAAMADIFHSPHPLASIVSLLETMYHNHLHGDEARGTNCPVALDRQDGVTTKLKTANPSLDTSIRKKEGSLVRHLRRRLEPRDMAKEQTHHVDGGSCEAASRTQILGCLVLGHY
ncbi:hypothetical protein Tco_0717965 [Tanacetum coccineum]